MAQPAETKSLHIRINKKNGIIEFTSSKGLMVHHISDNGKKTQKLVTNFRNVLYAEALPEGVVKIATLARRKSSYRLVTVEGGIREPDTAETAQVWIDELMRLAYGDVPPHRRFKVFVNPAGGQGKGVQLFEKKVKPILLAAHGEVDVVVTKHSKHAFELAQECALDFDALLTVSGDGLVFEVLNGFSKRSDAAQAFALPVCPIPAGSGNALSISLLGPEEGPDVAVAALNAIKGRRMPYDLCSFTQDGETSVSFLSQAIGLMADLDLGTEHLRWMGGARFIAGYLRGIINNKPCAMTLSIKMPNRDKSEMVQALHRFKADPKLAAGPTLSVTENRESTITPSYLQEDVDAPGWFTFDKPVLYVYSGTMSYVSSDLMAFPVALPSDGMVDITVQELVSRPLMVKMISGGETGEQFWLPTQHYFKAEAYRLRPHASSGHLSIDGERFPYKEFHVETLRGLGTTLSMTGAWYSGDFGKGKTPTAGNSAQE
ncbi:sphingosine kinase [Rhizoctonia solani]|uniref:Sphingosine kinase n=1 Tax=Rhizoctonia solani TaxID=456999 RepID=A0A0K6FQ59_9AGAM|nr:sphingosine kinase [Rhizoctonia solani]